MPKVTQVKARKDYPEKGIAKGELCYVWSLKTGRGGQSFRSKTRPKPSQLTTSPFWQTFYGISEGADELLPDFVDLETERDSIVSELESLRDDTQGSFDNMPEGLQQGSTGEMLENRVNELETLVDELGSVDLTADDGPDGETEEDKEVRLNDRAQEIWSEVTDLLNNFSAE